MKLLLDVGNTRVKIASLEGNSIEMLYSGELSLQNVRTVADALDIDGGMWCSTRGSNPELESYLSGIGVERLTHETPVPLKNMYASPSRLGMDRLAAAVGAWSMVPHDGTPILIVDAGTAITYDFVTGKGEFLGGNIAPGIGLRLQSLHEHTGVLPLVSSDGHVPPFGYDTETAIRSGVIRGINHELEGYVESLKRVGQDLFIFLTGGDSDYFDIKGKSGTFVVNNLLFRGLEHIIGYNEK